MSIGKHSNIPDSDFNAEQLIKGIEIEIEHTDDREIAKSIAKDHLFEIPDYYDRLQKMESEAKRIEHKNSYFTREEKIIIGKKNYGI